MVSQEEIESFDKNRIRRYGFGGEIVSLRVVLEVSKPMLDPVCLCPVSLSQPADQDVALSYCCNIIQAGWFPAMTMD